MVCVTQLYRQSFVPSYWQGLCMLLLHGWTLPESSTVKKSKDFCAAAPGPVSVPHVYPTSLIFVWKLIRIYFAKSYIIQNIVLHHLGYSRQFQPRSQLFPWATHPQQKTPRSSVSPGRLQFVICVASGRAGGVNGTVLRTCPVFEFSVGEFWFYFFVLLLIAMSYNWRCVYVWYVQLNSTYLLTYLLT